MNLTQLGFLAMIGGFCIVIWWPSPQGAAPGCLTMTVGLLVFAGAIVSALIGY